MHMLIKLKSPLLPINLALVTFVELPMAYWLRRWIPDAGVLCSKPLGGSKVDSGFHPSEVDKMSTRNFWELNVKK